MIWGGRGDERGGIWKVLVLMACWGEKQEGVRKLVWLAEQLFTSLSLFLPLPPSLHSALYSAEMTGGKLYCSELVSIGAPPRGETGGRGEQALFATTAPPSTYCPPSLHYFLQSVRPPHPPFGPSPPLSEPTSYLPARSEIQIQGSYSQRLAD